MKAKNQSEILLQKFKKFVKLSKTECSGLQVRLILKRLLKFNRRHHTSFFITWNQVGEADIYTWKIQENWGKNDPNQLKIF